jgi:hypothetical protein
MRTIKPYSKGVPFYIASSYRHVGLAGFPHDENAVSQDLAIRISQSSLWPALMASSLCRGQEARAMRKREVQIANSGYSDGPLVQ